MNIFDDHFAGMVAEEVVGLLVECSGKSNQRG